MKNITAALDKIASEVESHPKLGREDQIKIAELIDEISDGLDTLAKEANLLMGDEDEKHYMERYNHPEHSGAYLHDQDERYMEGYANAPEHQETLYEGYLAKYTPKYQTRDLNTEVYGVPKRTAAFAIKSKEDMKRFLKSVRNKKS